MSKRTTSYVLFSTLTLIAVVLFAYFMQVDINKSGTELVANMQAVRDESLLSREYQRLSGKLGDTAEKRKQLEGYILSSEADTVNLLSELDQTAKKFGVDLATKKLEIIKTEEVGFDDLSVAFIFSGSEPAVMKMLKLLETLPLDSEITSLSLNRRTVAENTNDTEISLSMIINIKE